MQRKEVRFFRQLPYWLSVLTGVGFMGILLLLMLRQQAWRECYTNLSLLSNAVLYPIALLMGVGLLWLNVRWKKETDASRERRQLWLMRALFLLTLGVQFLIARCCWYKMGWDVATVYTTAEELARGSALTDPDYFQLCPNNASLTILHLIPLWVAVRIGLGVPFVVLPYVDCILLNLSAYLTVRCVQTLTSNRVARCFALVLSIGWIALSPYILYPYSDTFSILFPVLALYVWLRVKKPFAKALLISLSCFLGAAVKPTVLIVLIAMAILALCRFLQKRDFSGDALKRLVAVVAAVFLGMLPGRLFQQACTVYLTGSATPQGQLSETHYLMLGMNGVTYGGHSVGDVEFSQSFDTLNARRSANLQRAWERLSQRSLKENLHFFAVKAYKAYADGSFASHSSFLELEVPKRTDSLSQFLRSLYHKRGTLMPYCQTLVQTLWLMVLTLCAYAAIRLREHAAASLLALTLLGLTAYLLLFEVWPRYLFLYAPFFVILSALAFEKPLCFRR